jgi:nucleotide-binding universal stress UspA family protein
LRYDKCDSETETLYGWTMTQTGNSGAGPEKQSDGMSRPAVADILALLHDETDAYPAAAYAVGLAETFGAHLTVTCIARDPARQLYLAQAQAQILVAAVDAARAAASAFAGRIAKAAADRGVSATPLMREIPIGQGWSEIAQFARLFDIAVLARPAGEDAARDEAMLEAVLLQAGRAVIAVPPAYGRPVSFARPVVAWDGSRSAVRALAEAMPILRHAGQARVITVEVGNGTIPAVPDIAPHIERHAIACTRRTAPLSGSVANTLLADVRAAAGDLLVMGAYGHSRLREMVLGGTTRDILRLADLPVLFAF